MCLCSHQYAFTHAFGYELSVYVCVCVCIFIFLSKHCGKRCRYYSVTVVKISHRTLSSRLLSLSVHFLPFACDFQTHIQSLIFGYTHAHTFHIITSSSLFLTCLFVKILFSFSHEKIRNNKKKSTNNIFCVRSV